jgi:hypothetical protein
MVTAPYLARVRGGPPGIRRRWASRFEPAVPQRLESDTWELDAEEVTAGESAPDVGPRAQSSDDVPATRAVEAADPAPAHPIAAGEIRIGPPAVMSSPPVVPGVDRDDQGSDPGRPIPPGRDVSAAAVGPSAGPRDREAGGEPGSAPETVTPTARPTNARFERPAPELRLTEVVAGQPDRRVRADTPAPDPPPAAATPAGSSPALSMDTRSWAPAGADAAGTHQTLAGASPATSDLAPPTSPAAAPGRAPSSPSRRDATAAPDIVVTIGRVEVRAPAPSAPPEPVSRRPRRQTSSLDDYLRSRSNRRVG